MRGDAALTARLMLFGRGRAGLLVAVGGALSVVGSLLPWYELAATVTMLGEDAERVVAVQRGVPHLVGGGWTMALGLATIVLGVSLGIDRAPRWVRSAIALGVVTSGGIALRALLARPSPTAMSQAGGADLMALRDELPIGIDLAFTVEAVAGCWVVLGGAVLALGGVFASLRSGER